MEKSFFEKPSENIASFEMPSGEEGSYQKALVKMRESGLMAQKVAEMKNEFRDLLKEADFLEEGDWEIMAVLGDYDRPTLEHCMETYRIAKQKVEKPLLTDNGETVILSEKMKDESVKLAEFYRTCLLHDIGKMEIPKCVLNNKLTDEHWNEILKKMMDEGRPDPISEKILIISGEKVESEKLIDYIRKKNIRPKDLVPVREAMTSEEIAELESRGISPDDSLGEIMKRHELASRSILVGSGRIVEGELAGQHHNYRKEKVTRKVTVDSLRLSFEMADLLRLADIEQALSSRRPYSKEANRIDILAVITRQSEDGLIGREIARLWIRDELPEIKEKYAYCVEKQSALSFSLEKDDDCKKAFIIKNFLETY